MKKPIRRTNNTILMAVEGYTEDALIRHLKGIYCGRDSLVSITVKNAKGKGPEGVVDAIMSAKKTGQFNYIGAVFDGDLPITPSIEQWFIRNRVEKFISDPAIEATLLAIRCLRIGRSTKECKELVARAFPGEPTEGAFYERHFPREVLDGGRLTTSRLNDLIIFMTKKS